MSFPTELEAFEAYAKIFPGTCLLLVDTYDTLKSGVPNAVKVFNELKKQGHKPVGIRLDSGDLAYLSKRARKMLDDAGHENAKIFASGDLDETVIHDLKNQGAEIDVWGVGTKLITSERSPALGGVYKLAEIQDESGRYPKLKKSDNSAKVTTPGYKKTVRIYDNKSKKAIADLIMLDHEIIDTAKPLKIFDPIEIWKTMTISDYFIRELLEPVFINGKQIYELPGLTQIQQYAKQELGTFWDEFKRLNNPAKYKVDLSSELYELKQSLLKS